MSGQLLKDLRILCPALTHHRDRSGKIQTDQGIAVIKPGLKNTAHQSNAVRIGSAHDFFAVKFNLMQNAFDQLNIIAVGYDVAERVEDQHFDFLRVRTLRVSQSHAKHELFQIRFDSGNRRQIFSQAGINQRFTQRTGCATHKQRGYDFQHQRRFMIGIFGHQPGNIDHGFMPGGFLFTDGIRAAHDTRFGKALLTPDG